MIMPRELNGAKNLLGVQAINGARSKMLLVCCQFEEKEGSSMHRGIAIPYSLPEDRYLTLILI